MIIVKVPGVNGLGHTKGSEKAPEVIVKSIPGVDIKSFRLNNEDIEEQQKVLFAESKKIFKKNKNVVFIGGDHSISFPLCSSFYDSCKLKRKDSCLIILDAHADCMPSMQEPTHEEWLYALVSKGFPTQNIILLGARRVEPEERAFLKKNKISEISIGDLKDKRKIKKTLTNIMHGKLCYVSLDIDVLSDRVIKATGYPEKGGLTEKQTLDLIEAIFESGNVAAVDLVEVNPTLPGNAKTVLVARALLRKFINCFSEK